MNDLLINSIFNKPLIIVLDQNEKVINFSESAKEEFSLLKIDKTFVELFKNNPEITLNNIRTKSTHGVATEQVYCIGDKYYQISLEKIKEGNLRIIFTDILQKMATLERTIEILSRNTIFSKTDKRGVITYFSELFMTISGYDEQDLIGKPHSIIRNPAMPKEVFKDLWSTIKSQNRWQGVIKNRAKNGSDYIVKASIEPEYNEKNEHIGYIAIRTDITQLEQEKNKALAAVKAKSEFLANMSHEIRTPLNAILGFIDLLKDKKFDEESEEYLHIIANSSDSLLNIINDILDFSKMEAGKFNLDPVQFSPTREFNLVADLFRAKCSEKNINFIINIDSNLPAVIKADILRIKQIISNLLSNAIKFSDANTGITFSVFFNVEASEIHFKIEDQGIGISKKQLTHILEPFSQAKNDTTRKYGGTGLGLSISNKLIEILSGKMTIKSELKQGSQFHFFIPVEVIEDSSIATKHQENFSTFQGHVLVVEDNKTNQLLMSAILKKYGLTFDFANDGLEGVEAVKNKHYDLVLMDENMPNLNGIEATKKIRSLEGKGKRLPIVALTANAIKGDRLKFIDAGMDEYLTKPINIKELQMIFSLFLKH